MKFENNQYWKHENCVDVFFKVDGIAFDDDNDKEPRLYGHWMIQGMHNWWYASDLTMFSVKSIEFDKWKQYEPKGSQKY